MNKKILLISYHFPPSQAVGGLRVANFARYLPQSGWTPSVLTIKDRYIDAASRDYKRLAGLEGVKIVKTVKFPEVTKLYSATKSLIAGAVKAKAGGDDGGRPASGAPNTGNGTQETFSGKLKRYIASLFLALPDYEKNWILPAAFRAVREVRQQKIDFILTSCPPYSVHLVGLLVHVFTGVRWIVDFRDPWYVASQKRMYPTCKLSRKIESWLEKTVIKRASLVVCNTEKLCETLGQAYSQFPNEKFIYIPNGISTDIFQELQQLKKYEKFTLTYTGSLYFFRTPEPIFKALKELIDEGRVVRDDVRVKLVGHCETIDGYPTKDLISSYQLEGVVEVLPPVSYQESLEIVKKSHVALLLAPDQPYQIPAKVYDYMGTGTSILALAGDGATADMVRDTETGQVFGADAHDEIKAFLLGMITNMESIEGVFNARVLERFDREKVVGDLASYLDLR